MLLSKNENNTAAFNLTNNRYSNETHLYCRRKESMYISVLLERTKNVTEEDRNLI